MRWHRRGQLPSTAEPPGGGVVGAWRQTGNPPQGVEVDLSVGGAAIVSSDGDSLASA